MNKDECIYGTRSCEIHPFFMKKREWSKVKDKIVGNYIICYLKTIQHRGRPIIIVDAFSGPGRFGDGLDGSPLIICQAIDKVPQRGVGIACLFSDSHPAHREALQGRLDQYIRNGTAEKPLSEFAEALSRALAVGQTSTLFFYLDPYGIKDLDFETVKLIYDRDPRQSTEVLINFNFRTFMRMSGNWSFSDSADSVAGKVKEAKIDTVNNVMGGDYWIDIVTDPTLNKIERENAVVEAYMEKMRNFFQYTFSIPVKELDETPNCIPVDELAKYHLIFGTRSPRAVVYMNDVALNALEPYLNQFRDGLLFDMRPNRYNLSPTTVIKDTIINSIREQPLTRLQIYEKVIPKYFLQRRQKDYRALIDELVFNDKRLFPDRDAMKRKNQLNDATRLSTNPWPGDENE